MKGFPKFINNKKDIYNLKEIYPSKIKSILQEAVKNYYGWVTKGKLDTLEEGITNDTHQVKTITVDEQEEYYQEEWGIIPKNFLDRIGMDINEAEEIANNV